VEGALEVQVLRPILLGNPVPQLGGSKNSLKPRARTERVDNKVAAGYLRDRDFDFYPPADLSKPTVDGEDRGVAFGWRWCRHETENYLIDPGVVSKAMDWPSLEYEEALRQAAGKIRSYEVARWTIGVVRRELPPNYELRTRPDGLNEIELPPALDSATVNAWASNSIADHRAPMATATDPTAVQASLDAFAARFNDVFVADVETVLVWFSGKDLLAGLTDWLVAKGVPNPGEFRASLRDWIIAYPDRALQLLPEWNGMLEVVRA
jgi:hypothetical protein